MITFKRLHHGTRLSALEEPTPKAFKFPAGEVDLKNVTVESHLNLISIIQPNKDSLHDDLFSLAMSQQVSSSYHSVIMPYFPGARADRGNPTGVKVYAEFLGSILDDKATVYIYDVHSELSKEIILDENFNSVFVDVDNFLPLRLKNTYDAIIAPDKGAVSRASAIAKSLRIPVYVADKTRDFETGKLTGYSVENFPHNLKNRRLLVVDDICDGGGTFALLANAVNDLNQNVSLDLYVSHGVFSGNALENLPKSYGKIITTDSYDPSRELPAQFERLSIIQYIENIITEKGNK